jgi:hypothetical protein
MPVGPWQMPGSPLGHVRDIPGAVHVFHCLQVAALLSLHVSTAPHSTWRAARRVLFGAGPVAIEPCMLSLCAGGSARDVVLRPSGELDKCCHPDASRKDVLLSRTVSERRLYLQVCILPSTCHVFASRHQLAQGSVPVALMAAE